MSNYMHPNPEAYTLFASNTLGKGAIGLDRAESHQKIKEIMSIMTRTLEFDSAISVVSFAAILFGFVEQLSGISGKPALLRSIFTLKKYQGDGLSKDTAIYFPQTTHMEAMRNSIAIVEERGIAYSSRVNEGFFDDWLYESYDDNPNRLWFKFKVTE